MNTCTRVPIGKRNPLGGVLSAGLGLAVLLVLTVFPTAAAAPGQAAAPALKALIVTGQTPGHDWRASTAALKQMLEDTGLFQVAVAESPAPGARMDGFEPRFQAYGLVVLDYSGDIWPPSTRRAFAAYVKNGGGVVVCHTAGSAFAGWPEYNEIIGLGGWANRNESFGPYVFWKDGKVRRDAEPGAAGYDTPPAPFLVVVRDPRQPITAGLPDKWMHARDELSGLLRGPARNLTVLATAMIPFDQGGTGRDEPVLFTVTYGAGRVFHTVLGHVDGPQAQALECAGFITTFQRGAEWAATGRVTQKVPDDFPATNRDVSTPEDVRLWPGCHPPSLEAILKDLPSFEFSRDEAILYRLRDYVLAHNKTEAARAACEKELLAGLDAVAANPYALMAVCRELRLVATEKSVPALESLLARGDVCDAARYALEAIPGPEADAALLRSLDTAGDAARIGVMSSLARRKTAAAVAPLAALVSGPDVELSAAAVKALSRIGGTPAASALADAYGKARVDSKIDLAYALLGSIDEALAARAYTAALALSEKLLAAPADGLPIVVRRAALRDKILSLDKPEAARLVLDTLTRGPQDLQQPAVAQVGKLFSPPEIGPIADLLPKLSDAAQIQLLAELTRFPKDSVQSAVLLAAKNDSPLVRAAALTALAGVGDPTTVAFLAERSAAARGAEQAAARTSLARLPGRDVDEAVLFGLLAAPRDEVKRELIQAVAARRIVSGQGVLMAQARSGSAAVAAESARALRSVASPGDIPGILAVLLELRDETAQNELCATVGSLAQKIQNPLVRAAAVKRLLAPPVDSSVDRVVDVRKRGLLLRTLGSIGDDSSLGLLRDALKDDSADIRDAAVRGLAEWPDPTPREDCLMIARDSQNLTHRVLALRGYVRMIGLEKYQSPAAAVETLKSALALTARPDEQRLVLGALQDFPSPEALAVAQSLLTADGVQAEAQAAADKIKESLEKKD